MTEGRPATSEAAPKNDDERRLTTFARSSPQHIAGIVYGTIVVLAALTAGAEAFRDDLWRLFGLAGTTVVMLWVAHVYSHGLGESLFLGRRLTLDELRQIAQREFAMLLASAVPLGAVVLGAIGVLRESAALWLAVGAGVAMLLVQGIRYARLEHLSTLGTIVSIAVNLALGLTIVALKAGVAH